MRKLLFGLLLAPLSALAFGSLQLEPPPAPAVEIVEINDITGDSFNFEKTIGNWVVYDEGAAVDPPVDCTGGTPNVGVTVTRTTSSPLTGVASGRLTKDASDRQGHGYSMDFTTKGTSGRHAVKIQYRASAGFVSGDQSDLQVYAYDVDNATLHGMDFLFFRETEGVFVAGFNNTTGGDNYRLCLHIANTTAAAWTFDVDQVSWAPGQQTSMLDGTGSAATRVNPGAFATGGASMAGGNSTASGVGATAFGLQTSSGHFASTTFGAGSTSNQNYEIVHSSGASSGNVQTIIQHLTGDLDTSGTLVIGGGTGNISLPDETAYGIAVYVTAIQTTGAGDGDTGYWLKTALVKRISAGSATLVGGGGATTPTHNDAGAAAWTADVGVSGNDITISMGSMPGGETVRVSATVVISKSNG